MNPWKPSRLVLHLASLPIDLLWGWPLVLLARALFGDSGTLRWESGVLRARVGRDSWLGRRAEGWAGVTLSPHAIVYLGGSLAPEELEEPSVVQVHEHVHVEQGEAACLAALAEGLILLAVLAIAGSPVLGAVLAALRWLLAHHSKTWSASLAAILRGEHGYRGSHVEEAAYARDGRGG